MIISIAGISNAPLSLGDLSAYMERTTDKTRFTVEAQVGNRMDTCSFTLMDTIPPTLAIPDRAEVIVYDAPAGANVVDPPNAISAYNSFRNGVGTEITSSTPTAWTPRLFAGYVATPKYSVVGPQRYVEVTSQDYTFRLRTTIVNQAFVAGSSDQTIIQTLGARYRSDFDYSQVSVVTANFPAISFPVHSFEQFLQRIIKVSRAVYRVDYFKRMFYGVAGTLVSPINFADRPSYAAWVLNDLPVAYWRLDDGGATAADATGGGNPGTITGGVTSGAVGPVPGGKGMAFDGTTGYVTVPDSAILRLTSGIFSIEAWVKVITRDAGATAFHWLVGKTAVANNYFGGYVLGIENAANSGKVFLNVGTTAGGPSVVSPTGLPVGIWHHIAATGDGATLRLYIDGSLAAQGAQSETVLDTTGQPLGIGGNSGNSRDQNAAIDEVAIYSYALSQQQILQHIAAGNSYDSGVIQDGPSGYWQLDDIATPAADATGNAHAGVITGGVTLNQKPGATLDGDPVMAFNGSTGIITIPQAAWSPGANNPFTIEAWVKPGNLNSTTQRLAGMEPVGNHGVVLFIGSDNKFRLFRGDAAGGIDQPPNSSVLPVAGQWFHVCATYDGTTIIVYVNAVSSGGLASARLADVQAASFTIGKTAIGNNAGVSMGKVAVFNYALSQAQVSNRYNEGLNQLSPSFGIAFPVEGIIYTPDGSGLVNKVWVIGGTFLSNQQAYTIPSTLINGTTYQFPLPGDPEPSGMSVTVAGVDQGTIGIAPGDGDISTPTSFRYNATIQHTPATIAFKTPPGSGQAVVVTGKFRYPLVQSVSDPVLIAATNGVIFEGVVRDKRINDFALCQTVGKNYLTNQGQTLKGGSFLTKWRGHPTSRQLIQPGQVFSNKNDVLFAGLLKDQNGLPTTTGVMVVTKLETSLSDDANQPYETILSFADRTVSGGY